MRSAASSYSPFILIPELKDSLINEYSRFITGKVSAEEAGKTIYNEWQRMLAAIRKTNGIL
jgi:hypothetical protein